MRLCSAISTMAEGDPAEVLEEAYLGASSSASRTISKKNLRNSEQSRERTRLLQMLLAARLAPREVAHGSSLSGEEACFVAPREY
jgi:hypothetical protein